MKVEVGVNPHVNSNPGGARGSVCTSALLHLHKTFLKPWIEAFNIIYLTKQLPVCNYSLLSRTSNSFTQRFMQL